MRVRAFEREGRCQRCGWIGGLDDGLCILCQNDPALTEEPATIVASAWLDEIEKQCVSCGADHTIRSGDLCARCNGEAA